MVTLEDVKKAQDRTLREFKALQATEDGRRAAQHQARERLERAGIIDASGQLAEVYR